MKKKKVPNTFLAQLETGHLSYSKVSSQLFPALLNKCFKFCIVRNPYDRFVSTYFFRLGGKIQLPEMALEEMKKILKRNSIHNITLYKPQHSFICDENGQPCMDYIGRFEQLQVSYDWVCKQISIPTTSLEKINASNRPSVKAICDQELKELIYEHYKKDFELFGYSSELSNKLIV